MKVLIIEDDPTLNKNIRDALEAENIHAVSVFDGLLAEKMLQKDKFSCVLMDVNLPGKNGYDVCSAFRTFDSITPVLMLTAFGDLDDKVKGFDCGVDDYLTKPFFMRELIVRIQALVKRSASNKSNTQEGNSMIIGDISINLIAKSVLRQGKEVNLTPREYQILVRLCKTRGEVVSKSELVAEIWGHSFDANTNTIEVYINFLRNKIDKPFGKNSIKTKVGYGYYIDVIG